MTVQFEHSPISAVRIGLHFNPPLLELRNEHVGMFWNRIRDQFPVVRQKPPLGDSEGIDRLEGEFFPTPRYWFVAENEKIDRIEMQRDIFALSWKRRDAENPKNPSFTDLLMPTFRNNLCIFEEFARNDVGIQDFSIGWREMSCKCIIKPCEYWRGTLDTVKVVPTMMLPESGRQGDMVEFSSCNYIYSRVNNMQLRVSIRHYESNDEPEETALVLDVAARTGEEGQIGDSEIYAWYDLANDAILTCLCSVTSKEIQRDYWKLLEKKS